MPSRVEVDLRGMEAMMGERAIERAQLLLTQRVCDDFKKDAPAGHFVPRDTGTLQDTVEVTGKDEVTWPAEYADFVYSGTDRQAANPWFENGAAACKDSWAEYVGRVLTDDRSA